MLSTPPVTFPKEGVESEAGGLRSGIFLRPCGELAGVGSAGSALEATEAEREGVGDFVGLGDPEAAF